MKKGILTYSREMQKNDNLWEFQKEDIPLMKNFFRKIVDEAKSHGITYVFEIYEGIDEACIDIFLDKEHKEVCKAGVGEPLASFGYSKALINFLEKAIKEKEEEMNEEYPFGKADSRIKVYIEREFARGEELYLVYKDSKLDEVFLGRNKEEINKIKTHLSLLDARKYNVVDYKFPLKLTYTEEMKKSDKLLGEGSQNQEVIYKLFKQIVLEAKSYGLGYLFDIHYNEIHNLYKVAIYSDAKHFEMAMRGEEEPIEIFSSCGCLINFLEEEYETNYCEPTAENLLETVGGFLDDIVEPGISSKEMRKHLINMADNIREWFNG